MRNGISLIAYHLPLDLHPQIGNNMMIAKHLALEVDGSFYPYNGTDLALTATLKSPMSIEELTEWLAQSFGRPPQVVGNGKAVVERIGWSSGASQDAIEAAAAEGLDLFISGEISERTVHLAREMGIYYVAAGHHATEKWGIEALGRIVEKEFSIPCEFVYIDNPV